MLSTNGKRAHLDGNYIETQAQVIHLERSGVVRARLASQAIMTCVPLCISSEGEAAAR